MSEGHDRAADVRKVAKVLRDGGYTYNQSKDLIKKARQAVGLKPSPSRGGSVDRLTAEELDAFMAAAYEHSGRRGLMMRLLFESGARVKAFTEIRAEDVSFRELEIRIRKAKGEKARDVPILSSLARELRLHLGERQTGYVFQSPRGGGYSKRRVQQIVKEVATAAGITKRVYPHLMRHTVAQRLADDGMPEPLLQQFLGHQRPETTQRYYEPRRRQVKDAHRQAMQSRDGRGSS